MKGIRLLRIAVVLACLSLLLFSIKGANAQVTVGPNVWTQTGSSGFGDINNRAVSAVVMFNGKLYAGTINDAAGGSIWSSTDAKTWVPEIPPGVIALPNVNQSVLGMTVYNGKMYISSGWGGDRGQVWSYDGVNPPVKILDDVNVNAFTVFAPFNGKLYLGTAVLRMNGKSGMIYSMDTNGIWNISADNGNGNLHSYAITGLAEFNGYLYAGVANDVEGAEIWRTDGISPWVTIMTGGFGNSDNQDMGGMAVYNNELYIGVRNGSLMNPTVSAGGGLYKTSNGTTFTPVTTNGFGDPRNVKVEGVFPFASRLFATTTNPTNGMQVWTSVDGANWSQAATNGFGNKNNQNTLWNNSIFTIGTQIYIGTYNVDALTGAPADGGQIWTYDPPAFTIYRYVMPFIMQ